MFANRLEDQQDYNPFLAKQPTSLPSQLRLQGLPAAQALRSPDAGLRTEGAAITKSMPEVAKHRAQLLSHWVDTPSPTAGTKQAAPSFGSQTAQPDDSFELLTQGVAGDYLSESHAPGRLTLPAEVIAVLAAAWRQSHPQGHSLEQGGLLLRNQDGSTTWQPGGRRSSGTFEADWAGVKPEQTVLATGHTHPYDDRDEGHLNVPFSGQDLSVHAREPQRLSLVRSGDGLFASARTKEFEEYVKTRGDAARFDIEDEIKLYWETLYGCVSGNTRQRAEVATRATSAHYHLLYYAGQHGILKKIDTSAAPQHQECFAHATSAQAATK